MKKLTTKQILQKNLESSSPLKDHFILWLHDIRSLYNVGAAFRSADAFGIKELWLSGFTPVPPRAEITKTAIGAEEYVIWRQITDQEEAIQKLKSAGYTIVALEQTDSSIPLDEYLVDNKPVCLILGNEVTGVDKSLLAQTDAAVEIPQFGMKHSLNVAVAGGVALYAFYEKFKAL
ncbi:MAG: RNA methyltransferase [Balneolaceae bacterium]|nr:RNA methyltransferase [Balneolaceae bacterium]